MGINSYNFLDVIYIHDPLAVRSISGPPGEAEGGEEVSEGNTKSSSTGMSEVSWAGRKHSS